MNPPAPNADLVLTDLSLYLPVLGWVLLFVVLLALSLRRERWLMPGTILGLLVSLAAFGFIEYRDQLHSALTPKPAPVTAPVQPSPPPQATAPAEPTPPPEPPPPAPPPAQPQPAPRPETPKLIPVDPNQIKNLPQPGSPSDLKTIRETPPPKPAAAPMPPPEQFPTPAPVAVVTPPPAPKPEPVVKPLPAPTPAAPPPAPKPTPPPAPVGPPPPKSAPASGIRVAVASASATSGNLEIQIQGPLLEIVKEHKPEAHLMMVVDGKYKQVLVPTRIKEDRARGELSGEGPVTAINYFWENVSVTFENLPAGPHSVMIDVSLEDPATHFSKMVGSQSTQNDWNGFVDVSAGQTVTIVFGGKNWMSQQLDRLR